MEHVRRMRRPKLSLAVLLTGLLTLAACGGSADDGRSDAADDPTQSAEADNTVAMELISFKPEAVDVSEGDTVTWVNEESSSPHTVTSGQVDQGSGGVNANPDGTFASGNLSPGDTFEFTFDEPGTFAYYCAIHPATMTGEVRVAAK